MGQFNFKHKVLFLALPIFSYPFNYKLLGNISVISYTGFNLYLRFSCYQWLNIEESVLFALLEENIISTKQ